MKKVRVHGKTVVWVSVVIEVEDNAELEDIIEKAYNEFGGVSGYCGNGGNDKLIGVSGSNESIDHNNSEVDFAPNGKEDIEEAK